MNIEKLIEIYLRKINKVSEKGENFYIIKLEYTEETGMIYCQFGYTDEEVVNSFRNHNFLDEVNIEITVNKETEEMKFNLI
ncbi:MAG: hypothetical protein RSC24_12450 [Clostridium sp.]